MKETYIVRTFIGNRQMESATVFDKDNADKLVKDSDKSMIDQGYRRVSYLKTRIDKKHITSITLTYQKD